MSERGVRPLDWLQQRRIQLAACLGGVGLMLSACTNPNSAPVSTSSAAAESTPASTSPTAAPLAAPFPLKPDLSHFLKPGTSDVCFNGGSRYPSGCGIAIREKPNISSDVVNAPDKQARVTWPLEGFNGHPANEVDSTCYDPDGEQDTAYEGGSSSKYWFKVLVPAPEVRNPALIPQLAQPTADGPVIARNGQTFYEGWAAAEWFGMAVAPAGMPQCSTL